MIIEPKVRGFICTAAHPTGCARNVKEQIDYVLSQGPFDGPKRVLVIGASTGYGLASRITTAFGSGAKTIGVFFERPAAGKRTASAGWYNSAAFEAEAQRAGLYAKSLNGDAFSLEMKQAVADLIREDLGTVDCVIYSLAAPRRTDPKSGRTYQSTLKPTRQTYTNKTIDPILGELKTVTIEPATEEEVENTIAVMGGEDWEDWMNFLREEKLLTDDVTTVAYSYIGPEITYPIYTEGTIGQAKKDLQRVADKLNAQFKPRGGRALISVNKALVTQASSAIPVVPLYISILYKVMKSQGTHEGCIEQMYRLFKDFLYADTLQCDEAGRVRVDDWEMAAPVQSAVQSAWDQVNETNLDDWLDLAGYRTDFYQLFGFEVPGVDYSADVDVDVAIPSITVETE